MVDESGLAPESYGVRQSFLHTYSAFKLSLQAPTDGLLQRHTANYELTRAVKRVNKLTV